MLCPPLESKLGPRLQLAPPDKKHYCHFQKPRNIQYVERHSILIRSLTVPKWQFLLRHLLSSSTQITSAWMLQFSLMKQHPRVLMWCLTYLSCFIVQSYDLPIISMPVLRPSWPPGATPWLPEIPPRVFASAGGLLEVGIRPAGIPLVKL